MSMRVLEDNLARYLDAMVETGSLDPKWKDPILAHSRQDVKDALFIERQLIAGELDSIAHNIRKGEPL